VWLGTTGSRAEVIRRIQESLEASDGTEVKDAFPYGKSPAIPAGYNYKAQANVFLRKDTYAIENFQGKVMNLDFPSQTGTIGRFSW